MGIERGNNEPEATVAKLQRRLAPDSAACRRFLRHRYFRLSDVSEANEPADVWPFVGPVAAGNGVCLDHAESAAKIF